MLDGPHKKPIKALTLKQFDFETKELTTYKSDKFESKVFKITEHGFSKKLPDYYELRFLTRVRFIQNLNPNI